MEPGTLPAVNLPADTVTVGATSVPIRALTRGQALTLKSQYEDDPTGAETYVLSCGVGVTFEEASEWMTRASIQEAGVLIDGILALSGLRTEEIPDPK